MSLESELEGTVYLRLPGATGREDWAASMQGGRWTLDIPVKELAKGLYFLQLQHGQANAAYRLIHE